LRLKCRAGRSRGKPVVCLATHRPRVAVTAYIGKLTSETSLSIRFSSATDRFRIAFMSDVKNSNSRRHASEAWSLTPLLADPHSAIMLSMTDSAVVNISVLCIRLLVISCIWSKLLSAARLGRVSSRSRRTSRHDHVARSKSSTTYLRTRMWIEKG
jgi:hypothetical protein